jgi:hypothetical protein
VVAELEIILGRTEQIITQTRSRLGGVMPASASRLVSLHDPDARSIAQGRLGKSVEFGYKAQVVENVDGIVPSSLDPSSFGAPRTDRRSGPPGDEPGSGRRPSDLYRPAGLAD